MSDLGDRLVLVTGAGSGIGRATALRFARDRATVVCADIDKPAATETVALIEERGGDGYAYKLDVADTVAYEEFARLVRREHGVTDVVVNTAGVVTGSRLFAAQMAERGEGGHIVNVSSFSAFLPWGVLESYAATKAAVRMLSDNLRAELAPQGIGVTAVGPGAIADERAALPFGLATLAERVGLSSSPDSVARAIVHAVHHNWAMVPVRPEAWALSALSRISPDAMRLLARLMREESDD